MRKVSICKKTGMRRGGWSPEEDERLSSYIKRYGHWNWRELPKFAGLLRCGKSCRLRWMNYLRPNIKRGNFTKEEDEIIIDFIQKLGNRWSVIAASLPGRTDNEIKNHWHTHLKDRTQRISISKNVKCEKKSKEGLNPDSPVTLILESSTVTEESPRNSCDKEATIDESQFIKEESIVSSNSDEEFDGNIWTKPLFMEDAHISEDSSSTSSDTSPSPNEDILFFYDLLDGCDMDVFFNNYLPVNLENL